MLTLSGWTQPADALAGLFGGERFDYSDYPNAEASFAGLKPYADAERVVAWSMGGQLALRAIAAGILRPRQLTLIATPYRFVGEDGMDPVTFELFRESYRKDAARTKQRFHGLIAKGDREQKRVLGLLGHHPQVEEVERWLPWLDDLGGYSLENIEFSYRPSVLLVHGEKDAIVPHAQSEWLRQRFPKARLVSMQESGHAPHLHDPAALQSAVRELA